MCLSGTKIGGINDLERRNSLNRCIISPNSVAFRTDYATVKAITPLKVIQGHRLWYQSKAHMRLPISDEY